ncbi:MAG: hypothetical protein FVQ81_04905 [Candidatus Glassbacteria bacterium]|nr:hypothetical protein [Candidatus Glassbacteria bacterium]
MRQQIPSGTVISNIFMPGGILLLRGVWKVEPEVQDTSLKSTQETAASPELSGSFMMAGGAVFRVRRLCLAGAC